MENLYFKNWFEDVSVQKKQAVLNDPKLLAAANTARSAAQTAVKKGQNPLVAAKKSILSNQNVPLNKLGAVLPTSDEDEVPN